MIVPSIDLEGGSTVQLVGGEDKALDAGDPRPLLSRFGRVGETAVIDLDAARGEGSNAVLVEELCALGPVRVGGGIRSAEDARAWFDRGARKVILGTAARPEILTELPKERVIAALDARDGEVVTHGWRTRTGRSILDRMAELRGLVGGFLVTFVEREGRMGGTALSRVPELVEAAGEDTVVMVVSDHGFARYETAFDLHRWLLDAGHSVPRSDAVLGEGAAGNLAERRSAERAARLGQLDLGRSAAWAGACEGPFGSIRLNVEGRDPLGCLDAATGELAARVESITRDLLALEFPDGERVVRAVHRGDELYPGPHAGWTSGAAVPDLIVELREDVQCVAGGFGRALSRRAPFPDHALDGILVMGGADVVQEDARGRLTLLDIAPMVLHALDEAVPSGMSGRAQRGFLRRNAEVRRIDDAQDESLVPTKTAFGGRERAATGADVTSRVQGLGYGR